MAGLDGDVAWRAANAGDPDAAEACVPPPSNSSARSTSWSTTRPPILLRAPGRHRQGPSREDRPGESTGLSHLGPVGMACLDAVRRRHCNQRGVGGGLDGRAGDRLVQRHQGGGRPSDPPAGVRTRTGGAGQRPGAGVGEDRFARALWERSRNRSPGAFRWAAWANPTTWPRRRCSWPRTRRRGSRVTCSSSTAARWSCPPAVSEPDADARGPAGPVAGWADGVALG